MIIYNIPYTRLRFTFIVSSLWFVWCLLVAAVSSFIGSFSDSIMFYNFAATHIIASFICFIGITISWVALVQDTTEESDTYKNIMEERR